MFTANSLDTTKISGDRMHSEHYVRACRMTRGALCAFARSMVIT